MAAKSYITDDMYKRYSNLVGAGDSKASACRKLKIPPSTMASYIKRMKFYDYSIARKAGDHIFIVEGEMYKVKNGSKFYNSNIKLIADMFNRNAYTMTQTEFDLFKHLKMNEETNENLGATSKVLKNVKLKNNALLYKGVEIPASLLKLVKSQMDHKVKEKNLVNFANLLITNPSSYVISQLYDFLQHNDIEICQNGYILAYKAVTTNFKDCYTKSLDNRVGKYVKMNREDVDDNPNVTCSHGLHVGSLSYIKNHYSGNSYKFVQCIIHPADFVSIPKDYKGAKARVCKYKVVADVTGKV